MCCKCGSSGHIFGESYSIVAVSVLPEAAIWNKKVKYCVHFNCTFYFSPKYVNFIIRNLYFKQ